VDYAAYENIRYNQVRQKSSHNSYERTESAFDQVVYWRIRSLEFDLHRAKTDGDWDIYHLTNVGSTIGNLDAMLAVLRGIQTALPEHEVITVFLDNKDDFDTKHTPDQLDKKIGDAIGTGNIYKPGDLIADNKEANPGATSLQAALKGRGEWPLLGALRGKFIFVITAEGRETYVGNGALQDKRLCFVAQKTTSTANIQAPDYFVFFNMNTANSNLGLDVFANKYVSRVYPSGATGGADLDDRGNWNNACARKIHHIATDEVNWLADPWSTTANIQGFPFEGIEIHIDPQLREAGDLLGMAVNSGDIEGANDSFYFWYADLGWSTDATYSGFVAVPGSHCPDWGKGGFMVRADVTADAPYFAILRPSGHPSRDRGMRVQYRTTTGGKTTIVESDIGPQGIENDTIIFFRLEIRGTSSCQAWASARGELDWVPIGPRVEIAAQLRYQGLAASSHDDADVKFLFGSIPVPPSKQPSFGSDTLPNFAAIGADTRAGVRFQEVNAPRREVASTTSSGANDGNGHASTIFNAQNAPAHSQFLYWRVLDNADAAGTRYTVLSGPELSRSGDTQYGGELFDGALTQIDSNRSLYLTNPSGNNRAPFTLKVMSSGLYSEADGDPSPSFARLVASTTVAPTFWRASGNLSLIGVAPTGGVLLWKISEHSNKDSITFNISKDLPVDYDTLVYQGAGNQFYLRKSRFRWDSFYVGSPNGNGNQTFLVSLFNVTALPPGMPVIGSIESQASPLSGRWHLRSSENFSFTPTPDLEQLYWEVVPSDGDDANAITFELYEVGRILDSQLSSLRNGAFTGTYNGKAFYIANPKGARNKFAVQVYGIVRHIGPRLVKRDVADDDPGYPYVIVSATQVWNDIGIEDRDNVETSIAYVSGQWTTKPDGPSYDANGNPAEKAGDSYVLPGAPVGALIGRIDDETFLIGTGATVPAKAAGRVYLCINDDRATGFRGAGGLKLKIEQRANLPFDVAANQNWADTGVDFDAAQAFGIDYLGGQWTANPSTGMVDADGNGQYKGKPGYTLEGANEGALIGRIRAADGSTQVFLVGKRFQGTAERAGRLSLCINDDLDDRYGVGLGDNQGSVRVSITAAF